MDAQADMSLMLRLHLPTRAVQFICLWLAVQFFHAWKVAKGYDVSVYIIQQSRDIF